MEAELFNKLLELVKNGDTISKACLKLKICRTYLYQDNNKLILTEEQKYVLETAKILNAKYLPAGARGKMFSALNKEKGKNIFNPRDVDDWNEVNQLFINNEIENLIDDE